MHYILQGIRLRALEELATRAHDMVLSIVTNGIMDPPAQNLRRNKEKLNNKKGGKASLKTNNKEAMTTNTTPIRPRTKQIKGRMITLVLKKIKKHYKKKGHC